VRRIPAALAIAALAESERTRSLGLIGDRPRHGLAANLAVNQLLSVGIPARKVVERAPWRDVLKSQLSPRAAQATGIDDRSSIEAHV